MTFPYSNHENVRKSPSCVKDNTLIMIALVTAAGSFMSLPGCRRSNSDEPVEKSVCGLKCSHPVWIVGDVNRITNTDLSHNFVLENESNDAIRIESVNADCGCLIVDKAPQHIGPSDIANLVVKFTPPPGPGNFQRRILVSLTKGDDIGILELRLVGKTALTKQLFASPPILDFGTAPYGKTRLARVSRYDGSKINVARIAHRPPNSEVIIKEINDGRTLEITLNLHSSQGPPEPISDSVVINTEDLTYNSISIPVKAAVENVPSAFVSVIFIASLGPGEAVRRSIFTTIDKDILPRVLRLEFEGDANLDVGLMSGKGDDPEFGEVQVLLSRNATRGVVLEGKIRVFVVDGAHPSLEIPIRVFVR